MKTILLKLILFLCISLNIHQNLLADSKSTILLDPDLKSINLAPYISFLEDSNKAETIDTIREKFDKEEGIKTNSNSLGFGYTKSAYWLEWKINISNDRSSDIWLELVSLIDSIDIFIFKKKG